MTTDIQTKSKTAHGLAWLIIAAVWLAAALIILVGGYFSIVFLDGSYLQRNNFEATATIVEPPMTFFVMDEGPKGLVYKVRWENGTLDDISLPGENKVPPGTRIKIVGSKTPIFGMTEVKSYSVVTGNEAG